ncbi:putative transmembrane protein [Toxoplasma gondii RUB]|uniref:Putative transmembrane protein n=1 Tax=Toxoplasma gondii RUB TaxID=935652 RepID=A0A086LMR0_TOXGO|nr:putative transmembrane protein [Toxoplasma gondii RUB]
MNIFCPSSTSRLLSLSPTVSTHLPCFSSCVTASFAFCVDSARLSPLVLTLHFISFLTAPLSPHLHFVCFCISLFLSLYLAVFSLHPRLHLFLSPALASRSTSFSNVSLPFCEFFFLSRALTPCLSVSVLPFLVSLHCSSTSYLHSFVSHSLSALSTLSASPGSCSCCLVFFSSFFTRHWVTGGQAGGAYGAPVRHCLSCEVRNVFFSVRMADSGAASPVTRRLLERLANAYLPDKSVKSFEKGSASAFERKQGKKTTLSPVSLIGEPFQRHRHQVDLLVERLLEVSVYPHGSSRRKLQLEVYPFIYTTLYK